MINVLIFLAGLAVYAGYGVAGFAYLIISVLISYGTGRMITRHRWMLWISLLIHGGVLALVFNSLAMGLTGLDAGIEQFTVGTLFQIIGASAILLVGHGINLFMSAISSFVHPMRLTFVEFFKNAGFEMGTRAFEPLKNE